MKDVFFNEDVLNAEKDIINSIEIPPGILMENAGLHFTQYLTGNFSQYLNKPVTILCGKGNNAGDGFVIARHLINGGYKVNVVLFYPEEELKGDALINYKILDNSGSRLLSMFQYTNEADDFNTMIAGESIIIDAVFGVGIKGALHERIIQAFKYINRLSGNIKIAVDIPSGLYNYYQDDEVFNADFTVSMGVKKFDTMFYNGKEASGALAVVNIGIPENEFTKRNEKKIYEIEQDDIKKLDYTRKQISHKYSNGKLLILGGSKGLSGAPYLSGGAGLRTGSGVVVLAYPRSLNQVIEAKTTESIKLSLPETDEQSVSLQAYDVMKERLEWADALLLGPGISKNDETMELVRKIITEHKANYVLDAEGTYALKDNLDILKNNESRFILTPHIAEFSRMIDVELEDLKKNFYTLARDFAKEYNVILVLKNAPSIITDGKSFFINPTGRENLATAGTGDVLSGIIASLFSQKNDALNAAIVGTYIHGMCGDLLYEETGSNSTLASDLIEKIPAVKNMLFNC